MYLAINYSTQAAKLLAEGRIQIERFKCPDWPDMIAQASHLCQVAVHFTLRAGDGKLKNTQWQLVDRLLEQTGTPYINLHLETTRRDFPSIPVDTSASEHSEQILACSLEDVSAASERYGADRVIIENVPYRGQDGKVLRPSVEPANIRRIVDETGCGLLLDISHARIAAHHLGMNEQEYMRQLPVDRLRELHFTGLHNLNGRLQDHLEVLEKDWPVLDWVLENIQKERWAPPWMLAFEYGGVGEKFSWRSDAQVIADQVPRLQQAIKGMCSN